MGRREEKKQETRERLRAAAFGLFERRGYDATKIDDVARAAGVSPRTVYRYFPSKADLIYWDTAENIARLKELIASRPKAEPPFAVLRETLIAFAPTLDTEVSVQRGQIIAADQTLYRYSLEMRDALGSAMGEALVQRGGPGASEPERRLLGHLGMTILLVAGREWRDAGRGRGRLCDYLAHVFDAMPRLVRMTR
jgi:AcrR family transcriptional regulator